ncbi:guanidino acid hydrolase, mitochondrial isoform X1 [Sebastes fasciatus]|uniref:guanidino acid hydrolase, mitochondrial isoform X1 n=1 Tax=Sebastes fasciatus TaxID=394691 RepID=UPI003D9E8EA5
MCHRAPSLSPGCRGSPPWPSCLSRRPRRGWTRRLSGCPSIPGHPTDPEQGGVSFLCCYLLLLNACSSVHLVWTKGFGFYILVFGPRQIRVESAMLRSYNSGTRAAPYESLMVADIGDVNVNVYDLKDTCRRIREAYRKILATGCIPLTMGGDHTIAYPILQAVAERHGPVGLVHVDAHADTSDVVLGEKIGHGTPFRRCVEEGLLDCKRVVQIGLRGSGYSPDSYEWSRAQGFRVVQVEECWFKSLAPLMAEVRAQMGSGPVYLSFDIDALDPGFAPGTGTPEIAGLTPIQGVEIIRGCRGLNLVGCDLVEVSPPYDTTGNTALTGANLLFEMLCVLPKIKYY